MKNPEERLISYAGEPRDDVQWCTERGYRAFAFMPAPGTFSPGLLLARGFEIIGIAQPGDVLVWDGMGISIRVTT
jgi:hypothetical protein